MQEMPWRWRSSKKSCLLQHSANTSLAEQSQSRMLSPALLIPPDLALTLLFQGEMTTTLPCRCPADAQDLGATCGIKANRRCESVLPGPGGCNPLFTSNATDP